jgi:hypothetical protein
MRFDSKEWVDLGSTGFSKGEASYLSLAFSKDGKPYLAYSDGGNYFKVSVMKFDSVFQESNYFSMYLFPNPATDKITIELSGKPMVRDLVIVNVQGQDILTQKSTEPITQIDISSLPAGIYFVRLTNDKTVAVGKIIKE